MPEIITEERLYKAVPPLYSLTNDKHNEKLLKGKEFLFDKNEYYDMYENLLSNNILGYNSAGKIPSADYNGVYEESHCFNRGRR